MPEFTEPKRRKPRVPKPAKEPKAPKIQKKPKQKMQKVQKPPNPQNPPKQRQPKQRRRQNMAIYYVMFFVVAVTIFSILAATVLFNLEEAVIEGESIYTGEQIIAVSGIQAGVNLIRFNAEDSRRRIIDSLVYVDDVAIRKAIPSRVVITITGAIEMASVAHEGIFYTISRNGRILETTRTSRENIVIHGFEADMPIVGGYISSVEERKTELIFTLIKTAEEAGLAGITSIDIHDFLDVKMNYMDRIVLHIGPVTDLEQKLRAAAHILENDVASNEQGTLLLLNPLQVVFSPE
ncbi:MAG: FtsQ-type POTRA domain-containing protein [Oscillospiraceae bacterium]|nr:FtsQ-type POTRA domain-containing protein [Oscillospiraceae bacterium]